MKEYSHPVSGKVTVVDRQGFLDLFDKEVHAAILDRLGRPGVLGVVCYENIDMCSSRLGDRTAMIFGDNLTAKTAEEACANRLGDVPSRFQYPRYIHFKDTPAPTLNVNDIVHQITIDSTGSITDDGGHPVDRLHSNTEFIWHGSRVNVKYLYPNPIATGPKLAPVSLAPTSMFVYAKREHVKEAREALMIAYIKQSKVWLDELRQIKEKVQAALEVALAQNQNLNDMLK